MREVLGPDVEEPRDELQQAELADRVRRYKDRCGLLNFLKPKGHRLYYPKQAAFVESVGRCSVSAFVGSNQCLAGHEMIYDPVLDVARRIDSLDGYHHVLAWNGKKLVVALALPAFQKGSLPTIRLGLSNGSFIEAAPNHRFLTSYGWRDTAELRHGSVLVQPQSMPELALSIHGEGGRSSFGTAQDSRFGYQSGFRSCDGQLPFDQVSARYGAPSRLDVQGRKQDHSSFLAYEHEGGQAYRSERIHQDQWIDHHSNQDDDGLIEVQFSVNEVRESGSFDSECSVQHRVDRRSLRVSEDQLQAIYAGPPTRDSSSFSSQASDSPPLVVTSMEEIKAAVKWDFHVPGYENYWHKGAIHSNSGKTHGLAAVALVWALGEYVWNGQPVINYLAGKSPVKLPLRIFYGAKSFTMAHAEVTMRKMNDLLPFEALGIMVDRQQGRSAHRIRFPADLGGSEIKLLSYEQDPEDYEGTTWHLALWDEPPPRHAYVSTARGCMKWSAPQAMAFTPIREPWLFDEIYSAKNAVHVVDPEDVRSKVKKKSFCIVNIEQDDSPYLTQEDKDRFNETLDPDEIESRKFGRWKHLLGRIYKDFTREKHVLDTDQFYVNHPNWKTYTPFMVVDPADRRPFACAWGLVTPREEVIFVDEWPNQAFHKMKSYDNNVDEYIAIFSDKEKRLGMERVVFRLIDPNFGQSPKAGTGRTLVEEFDNKGIYFDTRIDNEIESGHMVVREALRNGKMFVLDRCQNLIKSMESYTWDEYRATYGTARNPKEKPREQFKDFADIVRYAFKFPVCFLDMKATGTLEPVGFRNGGLG